MTDQKHQKPLEIDVVALKALKDEKAVFVLLDVREDAEVQVGKIDGSVHIPLGALPARAAAELPKDTWIVTQCRSGGRSMKATQWLREHGFGQVSNLAGGITAWSKQIDPSVKVA